MNIAPISEPKTMIPATAATQKTRREAMSRSYSGFATRRWRITNATPATIAMANRTSARRPSFGTGAKLMPRIDRPDEHRRQDPAQVVDLLGRLVDVRRHEADGHDQRDDGEWEGDEEDGAPLECSRRNPDTSGPNDAIAPPSADHRAIDRVRPGPDHSAAMRASVVG